MCNYAEDWMVVPRVKFNDTTIPFYDKYVEQFKASPAFQAPGSYDSVYLLKGAIERAGTLETEAVVAAMEKTDKLPLPDGSYTFNLRDDKTKRPHDFKWGPGYVTRCAVQWLDGKQIPIWPDGNEAPEALIKAGMTAPGWQGLRYEGTKDYQVPPWVLEYWKGKK
jgi:branched-chain amino acid transport system substrate-binding protein